jgi:hypothetical protein
MRLVSAISALKVGERRGLPCLISGRLRPQCVVRAERGRARSDHFFSTLADDRFIDLTEPLSQSDLATQLLLFRLTGT